MTGLHLLGTACGERTDEDGPDAGTVDAGSNCQPDAPLEDDPYARERDIDRVAFDCRLVAGTLTNQFLSGAQACPDSPIEICTTGELSGDLEASYAFSFLEQVPSSDPSRPSGTGTWSGEVCLPR